MNSFNGKENKFRKLRESKGVTQQQCADDTGISVRTLTRYENSSEQLGDPFIIRRLSQYYGVSMDYLYGDE